MLTLISSEHFAEHQTPPGHPERVARAETMREAAGRWRTQGGPVVAPHPATKEQLARIHTPEYIAAIAGTAGRAVALDPDTYTSAESYGIALLAAGAAVDAVDRVMESAGAVLAMVRPPGHHAERSRAMGFCLFNNVAVAAAEARARGARRVAIVDYDVHHGNGTQHTFEADPNVLYVSLHQFPFYPGTGAADETGRGDGAGFTVNLPLEAGATDEDYRIAFSDVVLPVLHQHEPDLIFVSAGFDAHERDPLAGMRLTSAAYGAMTADLRRAAEECCGGRLVLVTEGGYDLRALGESLDAVIESLAGPTAAKESRWPAATVPSSRGQRSVAAARKFLSPYWKFG
jgi:acetoin utilization deacetylase AcuC-like enzyme